MGYADTYIMGNYHANHITGRSYQKVRIWRYLCTSSGLKVYINTFEGFQVTRMGFICLCFGLFLLDVYYSDTILFSEITPSFICFNYTL